MSEAPRDGLVYVLGAINRDWVFRVPQLPREGETVLGADLERFWGGKGANQAVAAARWGSPVFMLGAVGDDESGVAAVKQLAAEGVDVAAVSVVGRHTGVAFIALDPDGMNQIAVAAGANGEVSAPDLSAGNRGDVLLCSLEVPVAAILGAVHSARRRGMTVVVNPAPALLNLDELSGTGVILTPNATELRQLTGLSGVPEAAKVVADCLEGTVITTLGAQGVYAISGDEAWEVSAPEVVAVDTTGAGDTFNGVLAAGLAGGSALPSAIRYAVLAASHAVTAYGARAGMPTRAELTGAEDAYRGG